MTVSVFWNDLVPGSTGLGLWSYRAGEQKCERPGTTTRRRDRPVCLAAVVESCLLVRAWRPSSSRSLPNRRLPVLAAGQSHAVGVPPDDSDSASTSPLSV